MAYKFQEGDANFDGEISGSSFRTAGSLTGSGDLAVTGNMHAAQYYGGGGNLTGISADTVDVTEKDDNAAYQLVGVAAAGTDVTLVADDDAASKFTFNPSVGLLSGSQAQFTGATIFGKTLNVSGAMTLAGGLSSSNNAQFVGSGMFNTTLAVSGAMTIAGISGSGHAEFVTGVRTAGGLEVSGATTLAAGLSSSADARFVGNVEAIGQIESSASILGAAFKTTDVTYGDSGISMDSDGGTFTIANADADQAVHVKLGSATTATAFRVLNSADAGIFQILGDGAVSHGTLSGSSTARFVGSISSSGDLAVTGNVHAAQFYGGGAGITGISSDAVDVTASSADLAYPIVFTQGAQADGSLGLGLNTALTYNPSDGRLSSSAGAQIVGATIFGNTLKVSGAVTHAATSSLSDVNMSGALSGSGDLMWFGHARFADEINVSGTISGGVALQGASVAVDGQVAGSQFKTTDVTYGDSGITMDSDGGHFTIDQDDADKSVRVKLGAAGAKTSGFQIRNSSNSTLWGVTDDGHVSGSGILEVVGNSTFGGSLSVTGAFSGSATVASNFAAGLYVENGLNVSGALVVQEGINIGTSADSDLWVWTASQAQLNGVLLASQLSSSGVSTLVGSISSSGDLAVTGAVHAAQFYGGGAGITGISSDAVDVTGALGASQVYGLVATQEIQSDGTLGLITTVSGASFNPLDATWGSKLLLSGNVAGYQTSDIQFGEKGGLGMKDDDGDYLLVMSSSIAGCEISGAHDSGVFIATGDGASSGLKIFGGVGLKLYNASFAQKGAWSAAGAISGAAGAEFVGASRFVNTLHVSGAISGAVALQGASLATDGEISGNVDIIAGDGGNVGFITRKGALFGWDGAQGGTLDINGPNGFVSGSGTAHFGGGLESSANLDLTGSISAGGDISGSSTIQIVGASTFGSTLRVTGAVDFASTLEVTGVYNHGYQRYDIGTITANSELTASSSDSYQIVSGGTSAITVTLPSASAGQYYQYGIKRHSNMSGNVVITGSGFGAGQLIDGESSITLSTANASVYLISDGTQWNIF